MQTRVFRAENPSTNTKPKRSKCTKPSLSSSRKPKHSLHVRHVAAKHQKQSFQNLSKSTFPSGKANSFLSHSNILSAPHSQGRQVSNMSHANCNSKQPSLNMESMVTHATGQPSHNSPNPPHRQETMSHTIIPTPHISGAKNKFTPKPCAPHPHLFKPRELSAINSFSTWTTPIK